MAAKRKSKNAEVDLTDQFFYILTCDNNRLIDCLKSHVGALFTLAKNLPQDEPPKATFQKTA